MTALHDPNSNVITLTPYIFVKAATVAEQMQALRQDKKLPSKQPEPLGQMRVKRRTDLSKLGLPDVKPASVSRRNARERNRVKQVNLGFETLRDHVPEGKKGKKMSKVETLRSAARYIRELYTILHGELPELKSPTVIEDADPASPADQNEDNDNDVIITSPEPETSPKQVSLIQRQLQLSPKKSSPTVLKVLNAPNQPRKIVPLSPKQTPVNNSPTLPPLTASQLLKSASMRSPETKPELKPEMKPVSNAKPEKMSVLKQQLSRSVLLPLARAPQQQQQQQPQQQAPLLSHLPVQAKLLELRQNLQKQKLDHEKEQERIKQQQQQQQQRQQQQQHQQQQQPAHNKQRTTRHTQQTTHYTLHTTHYTQPDAARAAAAVYTPTVLCLTHEGLCRSRHTTHYTLHTR